MSIEKRPTIVAERARFGDGEADRVIGTGQQQAWVTINERTSRYCLIAHVPFKTAQAVSDSMIALLTPFAAHVHTLTTDNGREFAQHERIAKTLEADFYFAHPYASWERGAHENTNGLIRQFFPKGRRFNVITQKDIAFAMHRLNHRPRKRLTKYLQNSYTHIIQALHFRLESAVCCKAGNSDFSMLSNILGMAPPDKEY